MKQSTLFEIKKKIVLAGNSRIFNNWKEHFSITVENFIDALEWLCEDQFDEYGRTTREIGLEPNRVVRLCAIYDKLTGCAGYVDIEDIKNQDCINGGKMLSLMMDSAIKLCYQQKRMYKV